MRYLIEKEDLYKALEEPIVLGVGDIAKVGTIPLGCNLNYTGKVLSIGEGILTMDCSTQYKSHVQTFRFKEIWSLEVLERG